MKRAYVLWILALSTLTILEWNGSSAGILGHHKRGNDEAVETLLAVGIIAKALADNETPPPENHCPPPIHMTKVVHVPVHTERIVVVKSDNKDQMHSWTDNSERWKHNPDVTWK
ncbi:uncharacterized protein LOC118184182 [Stegodyphus dumicola]|uniref:uncharacterized protein LOC118184182 n=1 Tax=Stegodyphus dumicola TaxID=202533 RepID=UPI0015B0ACDE|nr:uncharacterized protein LOC118184182 [Stegodyphus dumicola]